MKVDVILGLQWGDEGKGKIVDLFAPKYNIVARFQGGPNAGHTIHFDKKKFVLHTIPSGIFHPGTVNVIGNGVIIDPFIMMKEVDELIHAGIDPEKNLVISRRAHFILPSHRLLDAVYESLKGAGKIGSTLKGIGPAYTDKCARLGLRVGNIVQEDFLRRYDVLRDTHLHIVRQNEADPSRFTFDGLTFESYEKAWLDAVERMKNFRFTDAEAFINKSLDDGKSVLAEGAQGSLLDIDFGSYPFVTSSSTIAAGACSGLGVSPHRIGTIFGVFKAYCTRVGSGPFPTEQKNETGEKIRSGGNEFGATTGRPRRCGWLDLPALKYAIAVNGVDTLIMMKPDVLDTFDTIRVCRNYRNRNGILDSFPFDLDEPGLELMYDDMKGWKSGIGEIRSFEKLPAALSEYVSLIESETEIPVKIVSVGPDRLQTIERP
jgi:adenylosuccinate synthase